MNSVKVFGSDLEALQAAADAIKDVMQTLPGVEDLGVFAMLGRPNLLVRVDRQRAARHGVLAGDVNGMVQAAIGGQAVFVSNMVTAPMLTYRPAGSADGPQRPRRARAS